MMELLTSAEAWAALAIYTLACDFSVGAPIIAGLCAIAAYIVGSDAVIRQLKSFKA
jgi:phosphatidylcholine synthase